MRFLRTMGMIGIAVMIIMTVVGCSYIRVANERAVTVDEVIRMSKAGVDTDVIVTQLETTHSRFTLSADDIIQLTEAGVDADVIETMVESSARPGPFSYEYGIWPYENWSAYPENYFINYHAPYVWSYYHHRFWTPYVVHREPGLIGRFYRYYYPSRPYYTGYRSRRSVERRLDELLEKIDTQKEKKD